MRTAGVVRTVAGLLVGFVLGALVTISAQGRAQSNTPSGGGAGLSRPRLTPEPPATFLAWTPGGLPAGFEERVAALPGIHRVVVVRSDNTWLTRSFSANGELVDDPREGFAIPLEVAAVRPPDYAPFLPPADRGIVLSLAAGEGVLGASSARLRGLGPGAVLEVGDTRIEVAAVLPDELVGASELLVSRSVGAEIGVTHDRYALLQPKPVPTTNALARAIRRILPAGDTALRVRAPGETPYFRQGDAVLPPVRIKMLFGEFAAQPTPGRPGFLTLDPRWVRAHIATERVPLLGRVTCNVALFPQIRGAIADLRRAGLGRLVHDFAGCYSARFANRVPTASISHHTWGIALDINVGGNPLGREPTQDLRLVEIFEAWGFTWGGDFVIPDGMHFEYRRPPAS
ncbi:MAG: M15 family metallopeptidase [Actinomycetota bacterium]